ncbi:MAG TPA: DUF2269 family protein [Mycobacteriales bacterium]|nr:DUF2269 family protein [Mycobacteriales bacterium]
MHTFLKTLHVIAAVFLIGPLVLVPMTGLRAIRLGDLGAVRNAARQTTLYGLLSLLVFGLGLAVVPTEPEHYDFATPWVTISMTLFIVALALILGVAAPALSKAASLLESRTADPARTAAATPAADQAAGDAAADTVPAPATPAAITDPQLDSARGRVAASSGVASLLVLVITVFMVVKPF